MNTWFIAAASFLAGAAAGSGGTYTYFKEKGRIVPAPSQPVKK